MNLSIKLFADGADLNTMIQMYKNSAVKGFTTNPSLLRAAGVRDYAAFAATALAAIPDRPISFEVLADDLDEMKSQARKIASWGPNVYVKIPIINSQGNSTFHVIQILVREGIKVNVTAVMTTHQVLMASEALGGETPSCISIFAGRVADTGIDPVPLMSRALQIASLHPSQEIIWASTREVYNVYQADAMGCHIITLSLDLLSKQALLVGKDLEVHSLDTVKMFREDALASKFTV